MTRIFNRNEHTRTRRKLRAESPKAERLLWSRLRAKQLDGLKFRRQHGVGGYVVDLYCPAAKLAVEVDGESHFEPAARQNDAKRQAFIESLGIQVLRFTNPEVYDTLDEVIQEIWRVAQERIAELKKDPPESPLEKGGGFARSVRDGGDQARWSREGGGKPAPLLTKEGVGGGSDQRASSANLTGDHGISPVRDKPSNPPRSPLEIGGGGAHASPVEEGGGT